jgi:phage terminase small subunit
MHTLTAKQQRFVERYLGECRGNGARAAREAGYKGDGRQVAYENLRHETIRARVEEYLEAEAVSAGMILAELSAIALAPDSHFITVVRPADPARGIPMTVKLDYSAQVKSLELLGKFHGLWTDKVRHSGTVQTVVCEYADRSPAHLAAVEAAEHADYGARWPEAELPVAAS